MVSVRYFTIFRLLKYRNDQKIWVEGRRFAFTSTLPQTEGSQPGPANEVTAVIVEYKSDNASIHHLERFPVEEVLHAQIINFVSPNVPGSAQQTPACTPGELFCKTVLFLEFRNRKGWQSSQTKISGALRPLKQEEVGNSVPGTGGEGPSQQSRKTTTPYTFVDVCCSIGGASEAAELSGLKVVGGIEIDKLRAMCYQANFPTATAHNVDILNPSPKFKLASLVAAILHISMTCR